MVNTSDKHKQKKKALFQICILIRSCVSLPSVAMISSLTTPQAEGRGGLVYTSGTQSLMEGSQDKSSANNWREEQKPEECCFLLGTSLTPVLVLTALAHLPRDATVHCGPHPPLSFNSQDNAPQI